MTEKIKSKKICVYLCLSAVTLFLLSLPIFAQTKSLLKRTTYKTENIDFGAGGTVSIAGAPNGSISVEGWSKNEVEITADIEVQAENEADLALLAQVNTFVLDENFGHITIQSVGTYDKKYLKSVAKKFPKNLLAMPFRIDYRIKVPGYCDLEINGGHGDLTLLNVEGAMRVNILETNAKLNLIGGTIIATFGSGTVDVSIPTRGWRGRSADIQLASGTMNVRLPHNLSAEIDAKVLRNGQIENFYKNLKPRERTKFTAKSIAAKAGNGGVNLSFTVGDGALKLSEAGSSEK
ncbi:MAG TPA: DUF4097 family beta strand repeat-containing protein [Pyrinomonadaceae bacterium]|nr:DUF4097 family beta strand repeat-containing protein [Pyrinomonadaceae bacterium]